MSNTIQVRRGANASLPTLNAGELGFSTDTKQFYIGDGSNNHELAKAGANSDITSMTGLNDNGIPLAKVNNAMNLSGANLAIGSDANGDVYYRASGVLARLAKGTAAQVLTMNAGATAPEWAEAGGGGVADSIVKAWINFNGTGTIAINDSFNVTSITDLGVGFYRVTWDTDFANDGYACIVSCGAFMSMTPSMFYNTTDITIATYNSAGDSQDTQPVNAIAMGDQ